MSGATEPGPDERTPLDAFGSRSDTWLRRVARASEAPDLGYLGEYRVLDSVRGGQGLVLRAIQPGTEREVALKRVGAGALASEDERRRFEREVRVLSRLEHPCIVRVHGLDAVVRRGLLLALLVATSLPCLVDGCLSSF